MEPALLDGQYSMVQNFRQKHPGMVKRQGQIKQHSTADGTNKVMSLYQFVKGKKTERHFYAQMSDSDVLEATTVPPGVTTGAFGSEVFSGTASPKPASWANVNDLLLFANGVDTAQIYPGAASPVSKFIVYKGAAAIPTIPEIGDDYTSEVTDGDATTAAVLDSLGDLAVDFDCIFVMTPVPIDALNFTVSAANGTASTTGANYWNGTEWTAVASFADGTAADSKAFAQSGAMTWTLPTAHVPSFMYGVVGYWYQIYLASGDLDAETEVSAVTYESDWQSMGCVWDGNPVPIVEAQVYKAADGTYKTYGGSAIDIGAATSGDYLYVAAVDPANAIIVDIGTPLPSAQDIPAVAYWNGAAWTSVTGLLDGTDGLTRSGWLTFAEQSDVQKYRFNNSSYYAYWYRITLPQVNGIVCLNFDGDDAAQTTTDVSGKVWTFVGTAQLDTEQKAFGTASLLLDGDSDCIETPAHGDFNFGTGDFTFEWWWRCADVTADRYSVPISCYLDSANHFEVIIRMFTAGKSLHFGVQSKVGNVLTIAVSISATMFTFAANTWYHLALVRKDGVVGAWVDGAIADNIDSTGTDGAAFYDGVTPYYIGKTTLYGDYGDYWTDGLVMSNTALYTPGVAFTKPTAAPTGAVNGIFPTGVTIAADTAPVFEITDFGKAQTVCSWKNRLSMSTDQDHFMYLSAENNPQVLYGDDTAILAPGDGRYNRPVAQRKIHDDLLVWQEEKGQDGGCLTKFEWVLSVDDIKKTVVSTAIGTMNAKSVDVVDGVTFSELDDTNPVMSLAFFLSRTGVYVTNGITVYNISKDIHNYFDPTNSACIRVGYEAEMWLAYDSAYNVIRIGLVSGSSATVPNIFPVYDLQDKTWSFDSLAQELSCVVEAEAASGNVPVVQLGGGVDDGTVYVLNSGTNDVSMAIDAYVTAEIDGKGDVLHVGEILLRAKVQSAGSITVTPSLNSIAQTAFTMDQTAETTNETIRRHRKKFNLIGQHVSLKVQHATAGQSCYLLDMGVAMESYEDR